MLPVKIPKSEYFNEKTGQFFSLDEKVIKLEHSLISVSKWESIWHKSYLNASSLSPAENESYIQCMCLDPTIDIETIRRIPFSEQQKIKAYLENSMTATTFSNLKKNQQRLKSKVVTSELIYYWMIKYGIPFECEKWHFNRLLTLIRVCSIENGPHEKMSKRENLAMRKALNQSRKAKTGSRG